MKKIILFLLFSLEAESSILVEQKYNNLPIINKNIDKNVSNYFFSIFDYENYAYVDDSSYPNKKDVKYNIFFENKTFTCNIYDFDFIRIDDFFISKTMDFDTAKRKKTHYEDKCNARGVIKTPNIINRNDHGSNRLIQR